MSYQVTTFYRFIPISDLETKQQQWLAACQQAEIKGTILLAPEGINATLTGETVAIQHVVQQLEQDLNCSLPCRHATVIAQPFRRMKVKIKREIVTFGQPQIDPTQQVGTYVEPQDWNQLLQDPDVTVVDTRNTYEVAIGHFQGAEDPHTANFRQFPAYVTQHLDLKTTPKVAMYCTGGIRCEKASAYLLNQGFKEVYHLKGGILNYLETVPTTESLWKGECFVFDERVAVTAGLAPGSHVMCHACGYPLSIADQQSPHYEPDQHCPHCYPHPPDQP